MQRRFVPTFQASVGNPKSRKPRPARRSKVRQLLVEGLEKRNLLAASFSSDFTGYTGAGFSPGGSTAGTLDSNVWSAQMGAAGASVAFGGTVTALPVGPLAAGNGGSPTAASGLQAFSNGGNMLLGIQPTGSVFTGSAAAEGHVTLRVLNDGTLANQISVSYDVLVNNNGDGSGTPANSRANELQFSYSTDGTTFTPVPSATYTSPGASDTDGLVAAGSIIALNQVSINVAPNTFFFVRFTGADVSGAGTRDEFGIDNLSVTLAGSSAPQLSIAATDAAKPEGNAGNTPFTFTVTRSGDVSGSNNVNYSVSGGTATAADFGGTFPSGVVQFTPNQTSQVVTVNVSGDTVGEPDETFIVTLSGPTGGAVIATATAGGEIQDDDAPALTSLVINEVYINPPGTDTSFEYLEFRGTPGAFIPNDYYFLAIEGDGGLGEVDHIFTLGGMQIGANGFLVLAQVGNFYSTVAAANVISANGNAGGWDAPFSSRSNDIENGSTSFLLIQAAVPPVAGNDIDAVGNGVLSGAATSWTIVDGIGYLDGGETDTAYGAVVFSATGVGISVATAVDLTTFDTAFGDGFTPDYLARNGNTTGQTSADWIASDTLGAASVFTIDPDDAFPMALAGTLDHIGGTNVFGTSPSLTLSFDEESISEVGGTAMGTITRSGSTVGDIEVLLFASDSDNVNPSDEISFPSSVFILDGQASASFTVNAINDVALDGDVTVTVLADGNGAFVSSRAELIVIDDESLIPGVTVTQSGGTTLLSEAGVTDTYDLSLVTVPAGAVQVTVTADAQSQVSSDGTNFASTAVLTFTTTAPQTITVRAVDDAVAEGPHTSTITHAVTATADAANYPLTTTIPSVVADVIDNDNPPLDLFINEVLFNPPGTDSPNEYVEIRGAASSVIPAGTYLVAIEGDVSSAGDVQTIYNLSGLTFGSNGFLVITQVGNTYATAAGANVVSYAAAGFQSDGNVPDIENPAATFFLITTSTAPTLTDDIDANNDGAIDGTVFAGWNVVDQIAVIDQDNDISYSNITFAEGTPIASGVVISTGTNTANYVARIGNSTGSTAADWVGGGLTGTAPNLAFPAAQTFPASLAGARLDHIGAANNFAPAGVTITQSGGTTDVTEGGATDTYTIVLNTQPTGMVTVTVTPDAQLDLGAGAGVAVTRVFDSVNWATPQVVTVTAFDDAIAEGPHTGSIVHTITSTALDYVGLPIAGVTANITDNDNADVIPPTVTGIFLVNSAWLPGGQDPFDGGGAGAGNGIGLAVTAGLQIPNGNLNRIVVQFSEPVVGFSAANFRLLGVNTPDYASVSTVSYDTVNNRGVINLSSQLLRDNFRIGVSQSVTDAAGNQLDGDLVGGAGGNFDLLFSVLVGDSNLSGGVNGADLTPFSAAFNQAFPLPAYNINADFNSDGSINGGDLGNFAANFNGALPAGTPGPLNFGGGSTPGAVYSPAVDAFFKNLGDQDDLDLLDGGELF